MSEKVTVVVLSLVLDGEHSKEEIEYSFIPKIHWGLSHGRYRYYPNVKMETYEIKDQQALIDTKSSQKSK